MYTRPYRLVSALEITFWLVLLLMLGLVQPVPESVGTPLSSGHFIALVQQQSLAPQYLRRLQLPRRPIGEW
jgi:hypothetical protein